MGGVLLGASPYLVGAAQSTVNRKDCVRGDIIWKLDMRLDLHFLSPKSVNTRIHKRD